MQGRKTFPSGEVRLGVVFQDRQRIHIDPQCQHGAGPCTGKCADHGGVAPSKSGQEFRRCACCLGTLIGVLQHGLGRDSDATAGIHNITAKPDVEPECGKSFCHQAGGAEFGQSEFRMLMQIPPRRHRARDDVGRNKGGI
jgi:hypothetical protein